MGMFSDGMDELMDVNRNLISKNKKLKAKIEKLKEKVFFFRIDVAIKKRFWP